MTLITKSGGGLSGSLQIDTNNASGDPFGRQRVSFPHTIFDSKQIFDNQPLLWDDQETSGSGTTSTHSVNLAASTMGVGATTAGTRIRQTFQRFNYQPGKGQQMFLTGVLDKSGGGTGITRGFGLFDADNGIFLLDDEGTYKLVLRSKVTGSAVDTEVAQSSWTDPMDGTGASGITIDFTKSHILVIDFEWLGVGRVRVGFNIDGVTYVVHEFVHANNIATVYMSTPNLPFRYFISNDGTGAASTMDHICTSIQSEGGIEENGIVRYASTAGTHVDAAAENTIYAVLGIRLKSAYIGNTIKLIQSAIQIHTGSNQIEWLLMWNPTVAGTFTYGDQTNSAVQIATGATANTVTNGYQIAGGYGESGGGQLGNAGSASGALNNALILGSAIDGTVDEIVLCVRPVAGSVDVDVEGSLTWRELV